MHSLQLEMPASQCRLKYIRIQEDVYKGRYSVSQYYAPAFNREPHFVWNVCNNHCIT